MVPTGSTKYLRYKTMKSFIEKLKITIDNNGGWTSVFCRYHALSDALDKAWRLI